MASSKQRLRDNPLTLQNMVDTAIGDGQPEVIEKQVVVYQPDPNAIQRHDDGTMTYKRFTMTPVGLILPEDTDEPEWMDVGHIIRDLESSISWIIGDWACYAKNQWGAKASEIAERFGYETSTIETYMSICESIPGLIRNQTANFSHHRLVAKLGNHDLQAAWLYYMGHFRLRIIDAKTDMALLVAINDSEAMDLLYKAVNDNKRLIHFQQFKSKRLKPSSEASFDVAYELRDKWLEYVRTEEPKRASMTPDQKKRLAERYEWLGKHFLEQAKSIKDDAQ